MSGEKRNGWLFELAERLTHTQKEDVLQCANCGSVFAPEDIGLIHGGCNPWPIEEVQIGDESIVIPVASLDSMRNKFTTWKGPTE